MRSSMLLPLLGWFATAAAQDRPGLNLVTHSAVTIERPAAAIWPSIVDPSAWKQGAALKHAGGPAGKVGEIFAALDRANPSAVSFYVENVELVPNQRRTIKIYAPNGGPLLGYATWWLSETNGRTAVGYDVYSELPSDPKATAAQRAEAERASIAKEGARFQAELEGLKRLMEKKGRP